MIGTDADETGESAMSDGHKLIEAVTSQDINTLKELIKARHKLNTKVRRRCSTPAYIILKAADALPRLL
jgi:hypothetical protein